ncbi:MAG: hypothetical protein QXM53_09330, partial [Thermofilaceae archaeon]
TEDKEILKLADNEGWTVAHEQVKQGWLTEDEEILKLSDKKGNIIAFMQLERDWYTDNIAILKLKNNQGKLFAYEQLYKRPDWDVKDIQIFQLPIDQKKYFFDLYLLNYVYKGWLPDLNNEEIRKLFERHLVFNIDFILLVWKTKSTQGNLLQLLEFITLCKTYYPQIMEEIEKKYSSFFQYIKNYQKCLSYILKRLDSFTKKKNFKNV